MIKETLIAAVMLSQVPPGDGGTSSSLPVSPSVMATVMTRVAQDGKGELELLVLWRGRPGWMRSGGGDSSWASGSGGGGSMGGGAMPATRSAWLTQGGVRLEVRFEPQSRKLWIQDRDVALNDDNAVLVDEVDSPNGPRVARTLRIDSAFEATRVAVPPGTASRGPGAQARMMPPPVQEFIRRSPELVEFLRCDVVPPGLSAYEQQVFEMWCSAAKQP
jgi:hypothetical protein